MNHLVFLDTRAGELEKILSGLKRMLVKDFDPIQPGPLPVAPGDSLYFLRGREDRTVRVRATVARVKLLTSTPDEDLSHTLKEIQPRLQLTEEQYIHWSARRQVLLVEFEAAHKVDAIEVAPCRIPDSLAWVAFRELNEITEEPGLAGWVGAVIFVPTLALALGVFSSGSRVFEVVYVIWWYIGPFHKTQGMDFTSSAAQVYLLAAAGLLLLSANWRGRQVWV